MTRCAFHAINNVKQAALMVWNMTVSRVAHTPDRPAPDREARGRPFTQKLRLSIWREWWKMRAPDDARCAKGARIRLR
jgi:hypothetical protein